MDADISSFSLHASAWGKSRDVVRIKADSRGLKLHSDGMWRVVEERILLLRGIAAKSNELGKLVYSLRIKLIIKPVREE